MEYKIFYGNAIVIKSPSVFGQFMHHSRMYHYKFVRRSYRIWKGPVALSIVKNTRNICFVKNTAVLISSLEKTEV